MPNPLIALIHKHAAADFLPRVKRYAVGMAQDFWKDGSENPFRLKRSATTSRPIHVMRPASEASSLWQALPGEIAEKMWGEHYVAVADGLMTEALVAPLNLTKNMSVLDLSAGLGERLRHIASVFGAEVTGLEADSAIAKRGVEISMRESKGAPVPIAPYDPDNFVVSKKVDCVLARELFYKIADKPKFFSAIAAATNGKAHLSFTDYIVNPEVADNAAVKAWMASEAGISPLSLVGMAEAWAKAGFMINAHEDQTDMYRKEIILGLQRLALFLGSGVKPSSMTKRQLAQAMDQWVKRKAALDNGMKFYCFYGQKL